MKIGVVSNLYPPYTLGGYEILCQQTLQALAAHGHESLVLTSCHGLDPDIDYPPEPGVRRVLAQEQPFEETAPVDAKKRLAALKQNQELCSKEFAAFHPDLIFIWNLRKITLGSALAAQEMHVPVVYYECDDHLIEYMPRSANQAGWMGALADRFWKKDFTTDALNMGHTVCISRTLRETLAKAGLPVSHAQICHSGIALGRYPIKQDIGKIHHPARLLYLGPLRPNKRVEMILRALGMLLENEHLRAALTIAGNGDTAYAQNLQRVAGDLELDDETLFMGRLDYGQIPSMYRDHDLFIYASTWDEPFGLTHLEAMASVCPIVSTDCGGPTEYLAHEENALIVEKDNPRQMAEAIGKLLQNAVLRRRLAENARKMVELKFNQPLSFDQMEAYLKKVARKA